MTNRLRSLTVLPALIGALLLSPSRSAACTGISLTAQDGSVIAARTVEWALGDAQHNRIAVFPRRQAFTAQAPAGARGMAWTGQYGFVTLTAYGQPYGPDGLNEAGLYVGLYYLPGYAEYCPYDAAQAARSLSIGDFMQWTLSTCRTVAEVRERLPKVRVVQVDDERFGGAALPFHCKFSDPTGASIVVEFVAGGQVKVYDAFLGVITNSPTYDWHLTNLRNYLHLTPAPRSPLTVGNLQLSPLGAGSGLAGMPGDYTPPSRFVRAAALTASARPLASATDAVFEAFRILDSVNLPLGALAPTGKIAPDIESGTQITTACDLKNRIFYYHTMQNRQVRKIDLARLDFDRIQAQQLDDDTGRVHETRDLTPQVR